MYGTANTAGAFPLHQGGK